MERGDLAVSVRPRTVVVLEGVLATVVPQVEHRRFRGDLVTGYSFHWHETPLKRCVQNKRAFPHYALDIITFEPEEACDLAAAFLLSIDFPYDSIEARVFSQWTSALPYQPDITVIYDSDPERLNRYGQLGRAVVVGEDFR
jgi:hypothetical protein